jgi:hypothetical protein
MSDSDPIVERLHPCEASGDWATVVEVLTEARMEQRTLQPAALEISSRILCKGKEKTAGSHVLCENKALMWPSPTFQVVNGRGL